MKVICHHNYDFLLSGRTYQVDKVTTQLDEIFYYIEDGDYSINAPKNWFKTVAEIREDKINKILR